MLSAEMERFFIISWILHSLILFIPLYITRQAIKNRRNLIKIVLLVLVYILFGLLIYQFNTNFRDTEIQLILFGSVFLVDAYLIPEIFMISKYENNLSRQFRPEIETTVILQSLNQFDVKTIKEDLDQGIEGTIKLTSWFEYFVSIHKTSDETKLVLNIQNAGSTITYTRLLFLINSYGPIMVLSTQTFEVEILFVGRRIDGEILFLISMILLIVYLYYAKNNMINFIYDFKEVQKQVTVELVKDLIKSKEEHSPSKPTLGSIDLSSAKAKAEEIKNMRLKERIEKKREELAESVNSILGTDDEIEDKLEPELIKKQKLIQQVKTILQATPVGMEITLDKIVSAVESTKEEEIERIIIGLVNKNAVKGKYNVWDHVYTVGDSSSRFIEKTLQTLELKPGDLEYIKLNKTGDVEIKFKDTDGKKDANL